MWHTTRCPDLPASQGRTTQPRVRSKLTALSSFFVLKYWRRLHDVCHLMLLRRNLSQAFIQLPNNMYPSVQKVYSPTLLEPSLNLGKPSYKTSLKIVKPPHPSHLPICLQEAANSGRRCSNCCVNIHSNLRSCVSRCTRVGFPAAVPSLQQQLKGNYLSPA